MQILLILLCFQFSLPFPISCQGTYECGSHGRFEYCIDEIPGCIIGCHCHPGYYFDTDTKICEPNSKITTYHRRNNVMEPTRVHKSDVTAHVIYNTKFPSTTNKVDNQIDEITKDANDLGDWLYNQFFKTIENQVINQTNEKDVFTRRRDPPQDPIKKKNNKKKGRNGKSSKQRGKKKHLRRKLLRITENDSLFDLSSKSSSDSSDSSSSDTSIEYETNKYHQKHDDDDEHGHKKIVMINKKPKQQLPSFIFLPNLDTPFYPPIGLPPPPIIPMYPVVPIPPVPLCPVTGCDENKDKQSTSMALNTTSTATARSDSRTTGITIDEIESTTVTTKPNVLSEATAPNSKIQSLRIKNKKKKKKGANISSTGAFSAEHGRTNLKSINRQKILQRLKENMNNPSPNLFMPSWKRNKKIFANTFVNPNVDVETQFLDNKLSEETYINNKIQPKQIEEDSSFPDNVDFKYITELIHHVDLNNKSNNLPPLEYSPNDSMYRPSKIAKNQFADFIIPFNTPDSRRLNHLTYHRSDEAYYTNLGRQIAKLIRGNPQYGQVNIQLDETTNRENNDPYFNNNSAKSFWERSIRSPLTLLKANNKKFEYMKKSNELLFDIENKIEIIASTTPPLSLQEIENIVKVMEATKIQIQNKDKQMRNLKSFDKNLNVDLWPELLHKAKNNFQNSVTSLSKDWEKKPIRDNNNIYSDNAKSVHNIQSIHMHSIKKLMSWNGQNTNENTKAINQSSVKHALVKPLNKTSYFDVYPYNKNIRKPYRTYQLPEQYNPFSYNTLQQSLLNEQTNPSFLRHRKYFQDNNNCYVNQNKKRIPSPVRFAGIQPSYFHHEINNFDFKE